MRPDDLPVSVTDLIYRAPFPERLSQNDVKALIVHFWPSIEQHVREQVAAEIEAAADRVFAEHDETAMKARGLGLRAGARIARGINPNT